MLTIIHTTRENYESFIISCNKCGRRNLIAQSYNGVLRAWPICNFCKEESSEYDYKLSENIVLRALYHLT